MGKTMKKILCTLLVVVMCLTSAPLQGVIGIEWPGFDFYTWLSTKANAVTYTEEYYTYRIENDEAIITNVDTSISGDIIVPDSLGGHTVVGFEGGIYADEGFYNCDMVTSVHLPKTIKNVDTAFYFVPNLKEISVDEVNPYLKAVDGVLYNKDMTRMLVYPSAKEYADFVVPASVKVIDGYQNSGSSRIKILSFEQGSQLEVFYGNSLFYFSFIDELIIPKSCSIENMAIGGSCWVESLKFEEGREEETFIDDYDRLGGLRNIDLPTSFIGIGERSLNSWDLKTVTIRNRNCLIYDSADTIASHTVIYGYMNSTAHAYAKKYARTFVDIETGIVYENLDKVRIEFRFADTKEIIDTSDEHLMDQQVAFNFNSIEYGQWYKSAKNGILYLEEYYFPLDYFKADWQSAFGDRVYYICKSTKKIDAKAGDTIVIYLSVDENAGSVVTPPSGDDSDSENDNLNREVFPKGYDFYDDSYYFENYGENISEKYFTTMYEKSHGKKLYKAGAGKTAKNGLCFGMAYTTCAINNGFPAVNQIYNVVDNKKVYKNELRDVDKFSKVVINGNEISVDDYIKYAFIYQWSAEHNSIPSSQFKNTLLDFIDNEKIGVVVQLEQWETNNNGEFVFDARGEKNRIAAHAVVAVGIKQDEGYFNALIDDPNESSDYRTMSVFETDNTWIYREYSESHSTYSFAVDTHMPYKILATGNKTTMSDDAITYNSITGRETYIENMDNLSADKVLLSVEGGDYLLEKDADYQKIQLSGYSGDSTGNASKADMFWVDSNSVSITDFSDENSTVELAGDDTILSANVTKDSTVTMTIDEADIHTEIKTKKGDAYTVSIETITSDEDYNDVETIATINGTASHDEITATQTETGLDVTGISDGTITLTKDDKVIATKTIANADGDIEIKYDKTGGSDSLEVEYDSHTHTYTSDIVKEASCTENGICVYTCYCGDTYTDTIEASGHTLGDWVTVTSATCTENGEQIKQCENCTYAENQTTTATGHNFDGSKCSNCDFDKADECDCNCHKGGIAGLFFKIVLFFQRIFKTNKTCACGVAHY